ncbi:hypothetical protein [Neopusillimonas aromaticivorans]|uniref:hypothetical protein n=1 Tax=Neopusillimonas aromaticivorans TaxID=2979868 RepID=UPI002591F83E|nr:hypothetical protein [Neopusillimonas aromaticivorans]WJJ93712.1 hypothetical protein N7E01_18110 [Neopusillimonas aromaticivorans]
MLGRIAIDLTKDANHLRRLETTLRLAKSHNAEVVGIYPSPEPTDYLRDGSLIPRELTQMMSTHLVQERDEVEALFHSKASEFGVKASWRTPGSGRRSTGPACPLLRPAGHEPKRQTNLITASKHCRNRYYNGGPTRAYGSVHW